MSMLEVDLPPSPPRKKNRNKYPLKLFVLALTAMVGMFVLSTGVVHTAIQLVASRMPPPVPRVATPNTPIVLAVSITPITSVAAASSGYTYSGEAYEVYCTVTGTVTLYPAVHNGTKWEVYTSYPCSLDASIATQAACLFPARNGSSLVWNAYKTGSGSVASCTAESRAGPLPATPRSTATGTVTSVDCQAGLTCTPDPIVGAGTIAPTFGTATSQVVQGGVVTGATCASPSSLTFNNAGQITACTAGSGSSGGGNAIYGDGSDGTVDLDGTNTYSFLTKSGNNYTANRDIYPTEITVRAVATLNTAGARLFGKTLCTVVSGGYIHNNGSSATNEIGASGASALTIGGGTSGGTGNAFAGNSATGLTNSMGGSGGNAGSGGSGGNVTAIAANAGSARAMPFALMAGSAVGGSVSISWVPVNGGGGGGGAGGDGSNNGGGGGGGGGALYVACKSLVTNGTGALRANGGTGGPSAGGNSHGGGGGGGGVVWIVYNTKSGTGTFTASGGAGGAKTGSGTAGVAGSDGTVVELAN